MTGKQKKIEIHQTAVLKPDGSRIRKPLVPAVEKAEDVARRAFRFSEEIMQLVNTLSVVPSNVEVVRPLTRSATSIGVNFLEATQIKTKKDYVARMKICRKEAKESAYWLNLLESLSDETRQKKEQLIQESIKLLKNFDSLAQRPK